MEISRDSYFLDRSRLILLLLFMSATTTCEGADKVSVELYYETLCPYSASFIVNYLEKFYTNGLIDIVNLRLIPYGNAKIGPNAATTTCEGADKVSVELYYETLCPYSASFIVNYLEKFYTNGLIDIVNLRLIPYGNAKIGPNETISCQHGPYECMLNTIEACALAAWPNLSQSFPFIYCIESLVLVNQVAQWETCFESTSLDSKIIGNCYASGYGKKLELQYAEETNSLQPPHQYVPWVVVNGQPLYEDYENVEEYVCKAYKGSLPKACGSLLKIWSSANEKSGKSNKFCLKDTLSSTI